MTAREIISEVLRVTGMTQYAAASTVGWQGQQLNQRLSRGSLRADEFLELMDKMGVDVTFSLRANGTKISPHIRGAGRRVKGMCNKILFDTEYASALSNSFYEDGENKFSDGHASELYIDDAGRYFLAEYSDIEGERDKINVIAPELAAAYIQKYGSVLFKGPESAENAKSEE